jgi:hypothetical protein
VTRRWSHARGINSTFAITVSHIDNLTPARVADQSNWSNPLFVPAHIASAAGLDKEQIWADNASSSQFFGNVYVCYSDFHSLSRGHNFALFPSVAVSTDGGQTWTSHHVAPPTTATPQGFHQGAPSVPTATGSCTRSSLTSPRHRTPARRP